jgi:hypothetical protein
MRLLSLLILLAVISISCTKEVEIDIPGFEEQLVVEGRIQTGGYPIVFLSSSQDVYAPTDLGSYLQSFIYDATVTVTLDGVTTDLELMGVNQLPLESQKTLAEMLRLEFDQIGFVPIQVYSTQNNSLIGQVGKTYTLSISHDGTNYTGSSQLLPPISLDDVYWRPDDIDPEYGISVARLSDPANEYNAYRWEAKRINIQQNGNELDTLFRSSKSSRGFFDDQFFDGLTFEFDALNRQKRKDTTHLKEYKRFYQLGDSVAIRFSRVERAVHDFYDKRDAQLGSNGNPFATPVNIPSNIEGALGVWAGISTGYDTLYCIP